MKRTLPLLSALLLFTTICSAQANSRFSLVTDPYYGFPNLGGLVIRAISQASNVSNYDVHVAGPTGLRTEFFLTDRIGLGVDAIYNNVNVTYRQSDSVYDPTTGTSFYATDQYERTMNRIRVQMRFNFHFKVENPHFDSYIGLAAGSNQRFFKTFKNGVETDGDTDFWDKIPVIPFSMRMCWGMRYYFTRNIGMNLELGIGGPLISAGISTRFGLKLPEIPKGME